MMQLSLDIERTTLLLDCGEHFKEAGVSMLKKLAELDHHGPALKDGTRVQFGWTVLTLCSEMTYLRVYEPSYLGDALHALHSNLDLTLKVMTEQAEILRRENVEGLDARFDHYVVAWPGALGATNIFLKRQGSEQPDNTGWFIGDLDRLEEQHSDEELEAWQVFQILQRRQSVMKFLALPPGYAVVLRGNEINLMSGSN
jgi:hypothetical protein